MFYTHLELPDAISISVWEQAAPIIEEVGQGESDR